MCVCVSVCVCVCVCVYLLLCVYVALSFLLCVNMSNKFVRSACVSVFIDICVHRNNAVSVSVFFVFTWIYTWCVYCLSRTSVCVWGCLCVRLNLPEFARQYLCFCLLMCVSSLLHRPRRGQRKEHGKTIAERLGPVPQLITSDLNGAWHHTTRRHVFINNVQEDFQRSLVVGPRFKTEKLLNLWGLFLPLKDEERTWHKLTPHFAIHHTELMNCMCIYEIW
jgi:hypothetical protein